MIQSKEFKLEVMFIEIPKDFAFGGVINLTNLGKVQRHILELNFRGGHLGNPDKFGPKYVG